MIKEIWLNNSKIEYDLQYKRVKNINLRIKSDCTICVSANKRVPQKFIENFLLSKADFILSAMEKCETRKNLPKVQYYNEEEVKEVILKLCREVYPYFEKRGITYPEIKFRKMVSRWGSCQPVKEVLSFNTNLMYAPFMCIEYVVLHEFTHFLQANHSKAFYLELEKLCPDWKKYRSMLKEINLR